MQMSDGLTTQGARFLSHVLAQAMKNEWCTHEQLVNHLGVRGLMEALTSELRGTILTAGCGLDSRIAKELDASTAATLLQISLKQGVTTPDSVMNLLGADECVKYLGAAELWQLLTRGNPADIIPLLLEQAVHSRVLTYHDMLEAIGYPNIIRHLPADDVARLLGTALDARRDGKALHDSDLLGALPCAVLAAHLPPEELWSLVINPKIATLFATSDIGDSDTPTGLPPRGIARPPSIPPPPPPPAIDDPPRPGTEPAPPSGSPLEIEINVDEDPPPTTDAEQPLAEFNVMLRRPAELPLEAAHRLLEMFRSRRWPRDIDAIRSAIIAFLLDDGRQESSTVTGFTATLLRFRFLQALGMHNQPLADELRASVTGVHPTAPPSEK